MAVDEKLFAIRRRNLRKFVHERFGGIQKDAARAADKSSQSLNHYLVGERTLGERVAATLEKAYGLPSGWLSKDHDAPNVADAPGIYGTVPEISYVQAGEWGNCEDPYSTGSGSAWHATTMKHGPGTYALKVIGDSMLNTTGARPSYADGDIIVCDPTQAGSVTTKDRVIALLDDDTLSMDRRVTFKCIIFDGADTWLAPINKDYRILREPFQVLSKVLHSIVY